MRKIILLETNEETHSTILKVKHKNLESYEQNTFKGHQSDLQDPNTT